MKLHVDRFPDADGNPGPSLTLLVYSEDGQNVVNIAEGDAQFLQRWAEDNYPDETFPFSGLAKVQILDYLGCVDLDQRQVRVSRDPYHDGVWAVRVDADFHLPDFLIHADGEVEEVEFSSWPPTLSGAYA